MQLETLEDGMLVLLELIVYPLAIFAVVCYGGHVLGFWDIFEFLAEQRSR